MQKVLTLANGITLFRLFLIVPYLIYLFNGEILYAAVIFVIIALLDKVDGIVARKTNSSSIGAAMDSLADWLTILLSFVALVTLGVINIFWAYLFALVSLLIGSVKLFTSKKVKKVEATILGKITVGATYISIVFLILGIGNPDYILSIIFILGLATFASFILNYRKLSS